MTSSATARFGLFLNIYFVAVFVGIGGLQMFDVHVGALTDYGADLLAPPWLYVMFRMGRFRMRPAVAFLTVLGGCFLWEWAQRYDFASTPLAITRGTFDPLDLVAYTLGLIGIYVLDRYWLTPCGLIPGSAAVVVAS